MSNKPQTRMDTSSLDVRTVRKNPKKAHRVAKNPQHPSSLENRLLLEARTLLLDTPGWVYAINNEHLAGMVKIGMSKHPVKRRIKQLSTAFPSDFTIVASAYVRHAKIVEGILHEHFGSSRVHKNREFFMLPESEVKSAIDLCRQIMGCGEKDALTVVAENYLRGN